MSKYVLLKYRFFYVKSRLFHTSINFQIFNFATLIRAQYTFLFANLEKMFSLIAAEGRCMRKTFSKSSQICAQSKKNLLKFIVIVNVYYCVKFLSSSVVHTNTLDCILFDRTICLPAYCLTEMFL